MKGKLYRSKKDRKISGVCGGIGEFVNMDPTVIRVLWVILSILSTGFPGLIIYIVMTIIVPEEPDSFETTASYHE